MDVSLMIAIKLAITLLHMNLLLHIISFCTAMYTLVATLVHSSTLHFATVSNLIQHMIYFDIRN